MPVRPSSAAFIADIHENDTTVNDLIPRIVGVMRDGISAITDPDTEDKMQKMINNLFTETLANPDRKVHCLVITATMAMTAASSCATMLACLSQIGRSDRTLSFAAIATDIVKKACHDIIEKGFAQSMAHEKLLGSVRYKFQTGEITQEEANRLAREIISGTLDPHSV